MKDKVDIHVVEYSVLVTATVLMLLLFYYFRYDHIVLIFLSGVASLAYMLWGVIHHALEGRLTKFVAVEYITFGLLVFLLFFTVLNL